MKQERVNFFLNFEFNDEKELFPCLKYLQNKR